MIIQDLVEQAKTQTDYRTIKDYSRVYEFFEEELETFAELVRADEANGMRETYMKMIQGAIADEREACAAVVEGRLSLGLNFEGCAATIRARGRYETT